MRQEVAEAALLDLVAADHDVEQQPAADTRWKEAAICAASVGEISPGRNATRNFSRFVTWVSAAVVTHASSHQEPVGVSAASKPELLGRAGDLPEVVDRRRALARAAAGAHVVRADDGARAEDARARRRWWAGTSAG